MASAKDKGGRSSALKNDSPGIRKIHSRHTWVKSSPRFFIFIKKLFLEIRKYQPWESTTSSEKSCPICAR
jgi:hypothetical protein